MQWLVHHWLRLDSPLVAGISFVLFVLAYLLLNDLLASFSGVVTAGKTLLLACGFLAVLVLYGLIVWSRAAYRLGVRECHV